jgi:hypothetical protein
VSRGIGVAKLHGSRSLRDPHRGSARFSKAMPSLIPCGITTALPIASLSYNEWRDT